MDSKVVYENTLDEIIKLRSRLNVLDMTLEGLVICDNPPKADIHILGIENLKKMAKALEMDIYKKTDRCFFMYKGITVFCLI